MLETVMRKMALRLSVCSGQCVCKPSTDMFYIDSSGQALYIGFFAHRGNRPTDYNDISVALADIQLAVRQCATLGDILKIGDFMLDTGWYTQ